MNDYDIRILKDELNGAYLLDIPADNLKQSFSCYKLKIISDSIDSIEKIDSIVPIVEGGKVNYKNIDRDSPEYKKVCNCLKETLKMSQGNKYTYKKN